MKYIKGMFIFLASISFIFMEFQNSASANGITSPSLKVQLNNTYVLYSSQQLPYASNGRTLLPLRLIGDVMGATVNWNAKEQKATVTMGKDSVIVVLNKKNAFVNGIQKQMDTTSVVKNSTIMVPARFISEAFKIKIDYNKSSNVVHLTDSRIMSSQKLSVIDEMQRVNDDFKNKIIPYNFSFLTNKDIEKNKITVDIKNDSTANIIEGQLNRNIIFFANNSKISFIGTRGMIAPDGSTGVNTSNIPSKGNYTDEINWESLNIVQGEPLRYIFVNYFVTK
ncbi:hypothetical protein AWM70_06870 [Paenibacillus yonginensis]|uniref:Copper amine oxidase-like N-terminal domain-containing protein n=1 Tax=Paenibacillus yonginensis TaxID=1462996 RepID=A0A1B1MYW8_9BACL|nr:copper amine oxidase N-terminal domain-containing protein [Paenibacillus yonginensis]ANS74339.1 hypothetical protein AWM70_06870 [Paenibacillus yonginensis]